jgi:multiple sugar transport system substrate-binding protein
MLSRRDFHALAMGAGASTLLARRAWAASAAETAVEAAKQFAGTTLNVTWESGLQPMDPKIFSGPMWEQLTGIKINVIEISPTELFTKTMAEHRAGTGAYDMLNVMPQWLPDLVEAGAVELLDPFIEKYGYAAELDDIAPAYAAQGIYGGRTYGFPDDGDVLILYYRTDLFGDAANQEAFKARYGYDLAPPKDWPQFYDISQFFNEKLKPAGGAGSALIHAPGLVHFIFEMRLRTAGGRFFDPETTKATVNSDVGVAVLADMHRQLDNMPAGAAGWGPIEVLSAWLAGNLAQMIWWPPPGRWSEGYGMDLKEFEWVPKSQVTGLVGYALPPDGRPQLAAGFDLCVSSGSRNKEAAYLFAQWLNSKEISLQRVQLPYALRDPFRISHYESAEYRALWPSAGAYLDTLRLGGEQGLLDLSVIETFAYEESMTRAVTAVLAGGDAKAALDKCAAEWDALTDEIGVEEQKAAYAAWAAKPNAYPG